jgi:putative colanic acid biosynthesis UDP-glucose lipid carrier transferase
MSLSLVNNGEQQNHPGPLGNWYNRLIKRTMDVFVALFVTVFVLSWMTFILAIIARFKTREGVFFRQRRTCINGKEFTCIKYRTMRNNAEADLKQATQGDERITAVGKILRRYSLDEIPQFINVLAGDMSVIGPRPHMLAHTEIYSKQVDHFMRRHSVKPGITGLAQVNGYRGEIKSLSEISRRVTFDLQYIDAWSLGLDIKIFLLTLWVIIRGQPEAY